MTEAISGVADQVYPRADRLWLCGTVIPHGYHSVVSPHQCGRYSRGGGVGGGWYMYVVVLVGVMLWQGCVVSCQPYQTGDPRCSYIGQFLADGDSGCTYLVCEYSPAVGTDSNTGYMALVPSRKPCPIGTAVPRNFPIGYGTPCGVLSPRCGTQGAVGVGRRSVPEEDEHDDGDDSSDDFDISDDLGSSDHEDTTDTDMKSFIYTHENGEIYGYDSNDEPDGTGDTEDITGDDGDGDDGDDDVSNTAVVDDDDNVNDDTYLLYRYVVKATDDINDNTATEALNEADNSRSLSAHGVDNKVDDDMYHNYNENDNSNSVDEAAGYNGGHTVRDEHKNQDYLRKWLAKRKGQNYLPRKKLTSFGRAYRRGLHTKTHQDENAEDMGTDRSRHQTATEAAGQSDSVFNQEADLYKEQHRKEVGPDKAQDGNDNTSSSNSDVVPADNTPVYLPPPPPLPGYMYTRHPHPHGSPRPSSPSQHLLPPVDYMYLHRPLYWY